jgi:hypothetical protein
MRDLWTTWRWREEPDAPRGWEHPERRVVLVDGWLSGDARPAEAGAGIGAANAWGVVSGLGPVLITVEPVETLRWLHSSRFPLGRRTVLALRVERQADLSADAIGALMMVKAKHATLVISPREPIDIQRAWLATSTDFRFRADVSAGDLPGLRLVVVRGPTGPDAWPMHPAWVRSIKAQCDEARVAFAFTGWGDYREGCVERISDRLAVWPDGRLMRAVAGTHPDMVDGIAVVCSRFGPERSGRLLDGAEHLALPEGLR